MAPRTSSALAGGYALDPDLGEPNFEFGTLAGLHVLRHLQRYLDKLGMHAVLVGGRDSILTDRFSDDYFPELDRAAFDARVATEFARYRSVSSPSRVRTLLTDEPTAVPLFMIQGTSCLGWTDLNWNGLRLSRLLRPGQLFGFIPDMCPMKWPPGGRSYELHLAAWQAPFPTHSLVTWGNDAELLRGPQEIDWRQYAAYLFAHGGQITHGSPQARNLQTWFDAAEAQALAARGGATIDSW